MKFATEWCLNDTANANSFLSVTSVKSSKNVQVRKKSTLHSTYWTGAFKLPDSVH